MRVAIVHDDLVQWGGAERALLGICELFPEAPIYTSVFDKANKNLTKQFSGKKIITSFMQKIPLWRTFYKALLPLYPIAFEQFDFSEFDLVISQTTRFAKSVITKPDTTHISYIHTPPRFLWNFSGEKPRGMLSLYLSFLRVYDQISSRRVDFFIAGSKNSQKRIQEIYKRESSVCYPFVDLDQYKEIEGFDGGYFLLISRLNSYKRVDIAVEAFNNLGERLKIVGVGPEAGKLKRIAKSNVEFLGGVSEDNLIKLLAGCRALVVTAEEDFGLTPLEAQALGKGVIAYGVGGALETVVEGKTGVFFKEQTKESLEDAIKRFLNIKIDPKICKEQAGQFSKKVFQDRLLKLINER